MKFIIEMDENKLCDFNHWDDNGKTYCGKLDNYGSPCSAQLNNRSLSCPLQELEKPITKEK